MCTCQCFNFFQKIDYPKKKSPQLSQLEKWYQPNDSIIVWSQACSRFFIFSSHWRNDYESRTVSAKTAEQYWTLLMQWLCTRSRDMASVLVVIFTFNFFITTLCILLLASVLWSLEHLQALGQLIWKPFKHCSDRKIRIVVYQAMCLSLNIVSLT